MGMYKWVKDWDRGWVLQTVDPFEHCDHSRDFYLDDEDVNEPVKYEQIKRDHPIEFTKDMMDDLKGFHDIDI